MGDHFIRLEDLLLPGIITILSSFQLASFARRVGDVRKKLKIPFPNTHGDPAFDRAFRAQCNTLEFHPMFMGCVWVSSIFFHPAPTAIVSLVYIYARKKYFDGYCRSVQERYPGFKLSAKCLRIFLVMSVAGLATTALRIYPGIDLANMFFSNVNKFLPLK